ncbi:type 1 fimbrial protein [Serratia rubidaea]|nr:type 1 fimbrial protein [Serratia rubidaea]
MWRLGIALMLWGPIVMAGNRWNVVLPGGLMHFQGKLITEACTVDAGDSHLSVSMGQVSSNRFRRVGDDADPVPFDLHLQNCSTRVSQRIGILFQGVADGKNPEVLSVGEGVGIATGVGIALFDDTGHLLPINASSQGRALRAGTRAIHFVAKYRATGHEVTGGIASAQAWFTLTYQ